MADYGKEFEKKFKEDFQKIPGATINRIYDTTNGFRSISNISDFIGYSFPIIYYLEVKTHSGASFPLSNLTQYDKLIEKKGIKGALACVVVWLYDKDIVFAVPIEIVEQIKNEGKKSLQLKDIDRFIVIPSQKKRVFMDSDYSVLEKYVRERDKIE